MEAGGTSLWDNISCDCCYIDLDGGQSMAMVLFDQDIFQFTRNNTDDHCAVQLAVALVYIR